MDMRCGAPATKLSKKSFAACADASRIALDFLSPTSMQKFLLATLCVHVLFFSARDVLQPLADRVPTALIFFLRNRNYTDLESNFDILGVVRRLGFRAW